MDKEYYSTKEYERISEYKKMPAEDYRSKREFFGPKKEALKTNEENKNTNIPVKKAKNEDDSSLRKILDKITSTTAATTASATVIVAGATAVVVAPEIIPELPPILPEMVSSLDLSLGLFEGLEAESFYYTGEEIKPSFNLSISGEIIDPKDYTVSYLDNISPGMATIKVASNSKRLKGEIETSFIIKKGINDIKIEYKNDEIIIDSKNEATLKYYIDMECTRLADISIPGSYFVRAESEMNELYESGISNVLEYIVPIPLENTELAFRSYDIYYTGSELEPLFDLYYEADILDKSLYNIEYINNIEVGEGTVIVTPKDKHLSGSVEAKFRIVYEPPTITEGKLKAGNDFINLNYELANLKTKTYIDIYDMGTLLETRELVAGNNNLLFKDLKLNNNYYFEIYSNDNGYKNVYLGKTIRTLDGSTATVLGSFSPYLVKPNETSMEYDVHISDPNKLYTEYYLDIDEANGNMDNYLSDYNSTGSFTGKLEFCPQGKFTITVSGLNTNGDIVDIEVIDYTLESLVEVPKEFDVSYTTPTINDAKVTFTSTEIEVNLPFIINTMNEFDMRFIRVILTDNNGKTYEGDIYGETDSIYVTDLNATEVSISYMEVALIDNQEVIYNTYNMDGKLTLKESINKNIISVSKANNELVFDFDLRLKPGSTAKLFDDTNGTEEVINGVIKKTLPDVLTSYSYQIFDSLGNPVGLKESITIDPANYDQIAPTGFNTIEPKDVVKSYNADSSVNFYFYTNFKPSGNSSYLVKLSDVYDNTQYKYYMGNSEVLAIESLRGEYEVEYIMGTEINGVYYIARSQMMVGDTRTDNNDYKQFTSISHADNTSTTVRFEFSTIGRVYDFDNSTLYIGTGANNTITLNNSDFRLDESLNAYVYERTVDYFADEYDFVFKAGKNIKNLDIIRTYVEVKGSLATRVSLLGVGV